MNKERWIYQIRAGLASGIFMFFAMRLFDLLDPEIVISISWLINLEMLVELVLFIAAGVFIWGYYMWRQKSKKRLKTTMPNKE